MSLVPEFPSGDDLDLLLSVRKAIRQTLNAMGLDEEGSGVGVGGADLSFRVGDRTLWIGIKLIREAEEVDLTEEATAD